MADLPFYGYAHRDQRVRAVALVCDQYSERDAGAANRLKPEVKGDSSTGVYFPALAAGGPLDAPRTPRGGFAKSWLFDGVVGA